MHRLYRFCQIETITLYVGNAKTKFHIHTDLIFEASAFLEKAFNSDFKESSERTMNLPDDDVDTVDRFVQWLYSGQYDPPSPGPGLMELLRLAVLADKYDVPKLKLQVCMDLYSHLLAKRGYKCEDIMYTYANTPAKSGIRRMLVDWTVWHMDLNWFERKDIRDWLPTAAEFAADLASGFARKCSDSGVLTTPFERGRTYYRLYNKDF